METTSPPDMRHMKKSADKLMDLVMYRTSLCFIIHTPYTIFTIREKKLKMASGGELYVELC